MPAAILLSGEIVIDGFRPHINLGSRHKRDRIAR
jgi:hypothetical protein